MANIAAFNLPWLAKYYGLDWKTDSLTAAQSAADSLAKAEAERLSAGKAGDADSYTLEVMPEVRWYLGEKKAWYVGAMFKAGQFNYKFSGTGRQGDFLGGGITGGYQLRLNKALALDFTLGLGYLNADTEKYDVIDGVRVRSGNETKHWIGPINAGVTLVWKLF